MSQDRWIKETPTPGEDPRRADQERLSEEFLDDIADQEGLVHPQRPTGQTGSSVDAPGRDLDELENAPEVEDNRDVS